MLPGHGLDLACLASGEGPLVLLLHGFPDTARGWDHAREALAARGYRAVAPFMRGYDPSPPSPDGRYGIDDLARDAIALLEALSESPAVVVGHDWGATAALGCAHLAPERVRLLVTLAIPHPRAVVPSPGLAFRARHFVGFKLPGAVRRLERRGFAQVDELVARWSPRWRFGPEETADVKRAFAAPGSAAAAVEYYRQVGARLPRSQLARVEVPAVAFAGESDGVLTDVDTYERARRFHEDHYEVVRMPGGHFLHREHPERFAEALGEVLGRLAPA